MKWILTDIDGVLTDGRVAIEINGNETKTISYRDLDAIGIGRNAGYDFIFITGEDTDMARAVTKRFNVTKAYYGKKDKQAAMNEISVEFGIPVAEMLYIGDSDRDAPALEIVGLGIAPSDASDKAKSAANILTDSKGGHGVLLEVVNKLMNGKWRFP